MIRTEILLMNMGLLNGCSFTLGLGYEMVDFEMEYDFITKAFKGLRDIIEKGFHFEKLVVGGSHCLICNLNKWFVFIVLGFVI